VGKTTFGLSFGWIKRTNFVSETTNDTVLLRLRSPKKVNEEALLCPGRLRGIAPTNDDEALNLPPPVIGNCHDS
jgi:hypothetical protein